jgi:Fe-S-cluster containining protein
VADLDLQEMKMFAKWYGTPDLFKLPEFWGDCMRAYMDKSVTLPMYDEPAEREAVLDLVKCPPGECGDCCRYDKVALTQEEYETLVARTDARLDLITDANGNLFIDSSGGCPFLKDNICSIYAFRPSVCRSFPIVTPKEAVDADGALLKQIQVRIKCPAALEAVKTIFTRVCSSGKLMLLPDLSLIPVYDGGNGVLGKI